MSDIDQALAHHQAGRLQQAEAIYRRILQAQPDDADALHLLGVVAHQRGEHEAAVTRIRHAIRINPRIAEYHNNLGEALRALGQLPAATAAYQEALRLRTDSAEAHNNLGLALYQQGELVRAEMSLQRAVTLKPDPETFCNLGNVFRDQAAWDDAIAAYERALTFDPEFPEALNNCGAALRHRGKATEAVELFKRAIALRPDYAEAYYNLGLVLDDQGHRTDAVTAYRRAIAIKSNFAEAHYNLGLALQMEGELGQAIAAYQQALRFKPKDHEIENNLGHALLAQGKLTEAIAAFRKALALKPDFAAAHSNLLVCLNYCPNTTPTDVFAEHLAWGQRHAAALDATSAPYTNPRKPHRRLRIGYLSPDFRTHSVAFFIEPILATHDRDNYEIFCYANVTHPDVVTKRLQAFADYWRDIVRLSDEEAVRVIREDDIDVLVDLAGHTAGNRLLIFARQPAPVQVGYLGYPNTRGLAAMDYWLSDVYADPVGQIDQYYVEKVVRLPRGFNCYRPLLDFPEVGPLPAPRAGHTTFGSFNNVSKISEPVITCWAEILMRVPTACLLLKARALADEQTRDRLRQAFAVQGIAPERIEMIGRVASSAEHLALYNRVDIGLDTFPYNGHTTTCEALWMGAPVITLAGQTHAGRVGVSLLTHAGLPELIAGSCEAYAELAVELASDPDRLQSLRRLLRRQIQHSPLTDAKGFAQDVEAAYRGMWIKYCENPDTRPGAQDPR
jgi:predicted O-linked N-acetylglucosamine transferase (SPINDLY family)